MCEWKLVFKSVVEGMVHVHETFYYENYIFAKLINEKDILRKYTFPRNANANFQEVTVYVHFRILKAKYFRLYRVRLPQKLVKTINIENGYYMLLSAIRYIHVDYAPCKSSHGDFPNSSIFVWFNQLFN